MGYRAPRAQTFLPAVNFASIELWGQMQFRSLDINGYGCSLIVLDLGFCLDRATETILIEGKYNESAASNHGGAVAAIAASRHPQGTALSYGATVFCTSFANSSFRFTEQLIEKLNESGKKTKKFEKALEIAKNAQELGQKILDTSKSSLELLKALRGIRDKEGEEYKRVLTESTQVSQDLEKLKQDEAELREQTKLLDPPLDPQSVMKFEMGPIPTLSVFVLDEIERTLTFCVEKNISKPRVINASLVLTVKIGEVDKIATRLTNILDSNDMLFVVSAGNDGREVTDTLSTTSRIGLTDMKASLAKYPELLKRMIIVGAFYSDFTTLADFSNLPGELKGQAMIAFGAASPLVMLDEDLSEFGSPLAAGTSFAAPRVAAMAILLGKHFPKLSMLQIKNILLSSAYKPTDYSMASLGQGSLNPLQAWIGALNESKGFISDLLDLAGNLWTKLASW